VPRSELIQDAVVSAGYKLGIYAGAPSMPRSKLRAWADAPERGPESCTSRMTVSFTALTYSILHLGALHVGVTEPRFAVGATFRYLADLRKHPQLLAASDKLDRSERPDLKAFAAVELPAKYLG
jgi:hypothetical protein